MSKDGKKNRKIFKPIGPIYEIYGFIYDNFNPIYNRYNLIYNTYDRTEADKEPCLTLMVATLL